MSFVRALSLCAVLSLLGCGASSGFQQRAPREPVRGPAQINDSEVERAFALRAQLPKPYRLGVVFRDPLAGDAESEPSWRFEAEQRKRLMQSLEALAGQGELGEVLTIARSTVGSDDLHAIRVAAARHGADAVLVISGDDADTRRLNAWAFSYVALVPMLFAPALELELRFVAHAELWDVRNEYLYLAAEGEAEAHQQRPMTTIDREEACDAAREEALQRLGKELQQRFGRLHAGSGTAG